MTDPGCDLCRNQKANDSNPLKDPEKPCVDLEILR